MEKTTKYLKLETITPISVGTGEIWSPVTDFFVKDQQIYRINAAKFQNLLKNKNKIETFAQYVSQSVNESRTGTEADLRLFIENELETPPLNLTGTVLPYPNPGSGKEQVACCYQVTGQPVIPGSTLKGAVKTALFYYWLKHSEDGNKALDTIINHLLPKYQTEWFNNQYPKEIEQKFPDALDEKGKHLFAGLSMSDTDPFPTQSLVVYKTERVHLNNPKYSRVPQVKMCINKGYSSMLTYKSVRWRPDKYFTQQMNTFAYNAIVTEQEILYEHSTGVSREINQKLNTFYDMVTQEIDRIEESGELTFFLRIGSGKSFFNNTMAMILYETDIEAFKSFCKMYKLGKAPKEREYKPKEPFPVTRSVISDIYEPMGWVKISIQ